MYIMSNCSTTQKKTSFYPSKFDSQLEAANILTSSYLLVLSMIEKSYTPTLRRKKWLDNRSICAPKMAYFRTKLSLSGQNLQLSDKILKILARKTITYEKFYVRFAFLNTKFYKKSNNNMDVKIKIKPPKRLNTPYLNYSYVVILP